MIRKMWTISQQTTQNFDVDLLEINKVDLADLLRDRAVLTFFSNGGKKYYFRSVQFKLIKKFQENVLKISN